MTPSCGINEQLVNGICTCLPDFYLIKGACTYCAAPNYYDAQLAICRPVCTSNQQLDLASLKCVCIGGFNNIDGQCGVCPAYSVYNAHTGKCVCIEGYTFSSGLCIPKTRILEMGEFLNSAINNANHFDVKNPLTAM